jgi:hypothetical protein
MKKVLYFAAIAAMFAACSSEELANQSIVEQNANGTPINFSVYTQRAVTRAGVPGNDGANYGVTTNSLKNGAHKDAGFGVFGYYTNDGAYDQDNSTPNFMYNEQVTWKSNKWTYEPVKYWPNEFKDGAVSDDIDRLTFFAYAPWVDVDITTGVPPLTTKITDADVQAKMGAAYATATDAEKKAVKDELEKAAKVQDQQLNITQLSKNTATGDAIVKYVVDTKPTTSVDLLWGVAAVDAGEAINASDGWAEDATQYESINGDADADIKSGECFVDLNKEKVAATGKIAWNFKHALARLNVQIIAVVDKATPAVGTTKIGTEGDGTEDNKTNVWVRSIGLTGFVMKGALNLHSEKPTVDLNGDSKFDVADAVPNWKAYDGETELTFDGPVTFFDGLKDGKELTSNNVQKNETPTGLNPIITAEDPATCLPTDAFVNLWAGANTADDPIYVIPTGEPMDINIVYDIDTKDPNLKGVLSDGVTNGISIENKIFKNGVFPAIEAGKAYVVKIYVGLTSVKFDVQVTDWDDTPGSEDVELPKNM